MTIQEQRTQLENAGWFVGNRDRGFGGDTEGCFMVCEDVTELDSLCFVGDDLAELIAEAYNFPVSGK